MILSLKNDPVPNLSQSAKMGTATLASWLKK
jgi:hypothetical protein